MSAPTDLDPAALLEKARRLLVRGDVESAEEALLRCLRSGPDTRTEIEVLALLGEVLVNVGDRDRGTETLRTCRERIDALTPKRAAGFAEQRRLCERYLAELEPVDPRFVEWAD